MHKSILSIALSIAVMSAFAGVPVPWDVRLGDSSSSSITSPFLITAMNGETTDLQPRLMNRGRPITLETNALVRAYFREYGTTNSFVTASNAGTVYTDVANKGRVQVQCITTDYPATTNEFYVGVEDDGMVFRAWGKLTVQDSVGINPTTNENGRTIIDWDTVDNINEEEAPFLLTSFDIAATLLSNKTYSIIISQ